MKTVAPIDICSTLQHAKRNEKLNGTQLFNLGRRCTEILGQNAVEWSVSSRKLDILTSHRFIEKDLENRRLTLKLDWIFFFSIVRLEIMTKQQKRQYPSVKLIWLNACIGILTSTKKRKVQMEKAKVYIQSAYRPDHEKKETIVQRWRRMFVFSTDFGQKSKLFLILFSSMRTFFVARLHSYELEHTSIKWKSLIHQIIILYFVWNFSISIDFPRASYSNNESTNSFRCLIVWPIAANGIT